MRTPLLLLMALFFFASCTKKETITDINHINQIIDENIAPPYDGVTSVEVDNYVNKVYIDLYGREPLDSELEFSTAMLKDGGLTPEVRELFLDDIQSSAEYFTRFWEIYNQAYLQNVTEDYINFQIILYTQAYNDELQNGNTAFAQRIMQEIIRFEKLRDAPADYENGLIDIKEFFRRIADNGVYDEINMGSENFVISCFEHFFKRFPTEAELPAAVTMVDGFAAQILLEDGNNKADFLDIILSNGEFYQGLVFDIYQQLLSRIPDSAEMGESTLELTEFGSYQSIQRKLMISEDYAGF